MNNAWLLGRHLPLGCSHARKCREAASSASSSCMHLMAFSPGMRAHGGSELLACDPQMSYSQGAARGSTSGPRAVGRLGLFQQSCIKTLR